MRSPMIVVWALVLGLLPAALLAQGSSDEAAVWSAVERQWRAVQGDDASWVEEMLSGDFVGWPTESPAPRNKTSTRLWNDFDSRQTELLEFELYPLSIIVHGNMAVVHYLYTAAREADDEVTTRNGRFTDVLVRDDDDWKFIAWHGGDDAE